MRSFFHHQRNTVRAFTLFLQFLGFLTLVFLLVELGQFFSLLANDKDVRRGVVISMGGYSGLSSSNLAEYYNMAHDPVKVLTPEMFRAKNQGKYIDRKLKILCWVTSYHQRMKRAQSAASTWGLDCDKFLIMSDSYRDQNYEDNVISLPVDSDYENLWQRTQFAMKYLKRNENLDEYDFILKADDDTFVSIPHLRSFLNGSLMATASDQLYLGHPLTSPRLGTWMSGGAGYVLSRAALHALTEHLSKLAPAGLLAAHVPEDAAVGLCLAATGVDFVAGISSNRELLFTPIELDNLLSGKEEDWYKELKAAVVLADGTQFGSVGCCGRELISAHYVNREEMVKMDFMINGRVRKRKKRRRRRKKYD